MSISIPISRTFRFSIAIFDVLPDYTGLISQLTLYSRAFSSHGCFFHMACRLFDLVNDRDM